MQLNPKQDREQIINRLKLSPSIFGTIKFASPAKAGTAVKNIAIRAENKYLTELVIFLKNGIIFSFFLSAYSPNYITLFDF